MQWNFFWQAVIWLAHLGLAQLAHSRCGVSVTKNVNKWIIISSKWPARRSVSTNQDQVKKLGKQGKLAISFGPAMSHGQPGLQGLI